MLVLLKYNGLQCAAGSAEDTELRLHILLVICVAKEEKDTEVDQAELESQRYHYKLRNLGQVTCFSKPNIFHLLKVVVIRDYMEYAKYTMAIL